MEYLSETTELNEA